MAASPLTLSRLFWSVARDVNRTVGGGLASMELLRRSYEKAGWLTPAEHALLVAVSRLTPGTNILAYCVALGWLRHRAAGALLALLASSVPATVVVVALSVALVRVDEYPVVQTLLAVAMLVTTKRGWTLALIAIVLLLAAAGVTPVRVLLVAAVLGALLPLPIPARAGSGIAP
jgi:chromate transporter